MSQDIFDKINTTILDLQASQFQTFKKPLSKLGQLLQHPDLKPFNDELTKDLDLDEFLSQSAATETGMTGTAYLVWPNDERNTLGLTLLLLERLTRNPDYTVDFSHRFFHSSTSFIKNIHNLTGQLIIPFARDYKEYVLSKGDIEIAIKKTITSNKKIFIVHGHDEGARETVARFLERIGLEAIILHEQANQGRTIIEKITIHGDVGFAVVLLTPDDEGRMRDKETLNPRARQNVILELGYFIGRLGREKVCALKRGDLEIPSDYMGVVWENMDSNGGWKQALARELKIAGYAIDWNKVMQ